MLLKSQAIPRAESAGGTHNLRPSLLRALKDSPTAAVASDANGRVVFWNRAAERELSRPAASSLGRPCHELIQARDVFGNRFCAESCPLVDMARRNEAIRPFEWRLGGPRGDPGRKGLVQVLRLPGEAPGEYSLVHLLGPIVDGLPSLAAAVGPRSRPTGS